MPFERTPLPIKLDHETRQGLALLVRAQGKTPDEAHLRAEAERILANGVTESLMRQRAFASARGRLR